MSIWEFEGGPLDGASNRHDTRPAANRQCHAPRATRCQRDRAWRARLGAASPSTHSQVGREAAAGTRPPRRAVASHGCTSVRKRIGLRAAASTLALPELSQALGVRRLHFAAVGLEVLFHFGESKVHPFELAWANDELPLASIILTAKDFDGLHNRSQHRRLGQAKSKGKPTSYLQ